MDIKTKYDIGEEVCIVVADGSYAERTIESIEIVKSNITGNIEIEYKFENFKTTYLEKYVHPLSVLYEKEIRKRELRIEDLEREIAGLKDALSEGL